VVGVCAEHDPALLAQVGQQAHKLQLVNVRGRVRVLFARRLLAKQTPQAFVHDSVQAALAAFVQRYLQKAAICPSNLNLLQYYKRARKRWMQSHGPKAFSRGALPSNAAPLRQHFVRLTALPKRIRVEGAATVPTIPRLLLERGL
jgi:hypothetical protein